MQAPRTGVRGGCTLLAVTFPQDFISKLPDVGTTIFTVMSRRAAEQGAVNVGQGFPDYPIDQRLAACVGDAAREAGIYGVVREALSYIYRALFGGAA